MIAVAIELKGSQTETHCSMTSSFDACEKLYTNSGLCRFFKKKLEYDWDAHAYKRTDECKKSLAEELKRLTEQNEELEKRIDELELSLGIR